MKTKNIALFLIGLEMFSAVPMTAFATTEVSPETQMIGQMISVQGSATDSKTADAEMLRIGTAYAQATVNESDDQRAANLSTALVAMQITTPGQAEALVNQFRASSDPAQIVGLVNNVKGAQFSECSAASATVDMFLASAGIIAGAVGVGYEIGQTTRDFTIPASTRPLIYGGFGAAGVAGILLLFHMHDCA